LKHANKKIFLHPGQFSFTEKDVHIHTLLGSCIAITLWHPRLHIGGMCHFTLPSYIGEPVSNRKLSGRYADDVMQMFRHEAERYNTILSEYDAKVFGGGNMIRLKGENVDNTIGTKNASAAMKLLMQENINIMVMHVGEFGHRRIAFDVMTGDVWVRHVGKNGERLPAISGRI